jgi:hypothetical protein
MGQTLPDSGSARATIEYALTLASSERPDSALTLLRSAVESLRASGDSSGVLRGLNMTGYTLLRMQRLAAAESTLATAEILARARLHQDLIDATSSFNLISYTWLAQDHYESAHRYSSLA